MTTTSVSATRRRLLFQGDSITDAFRDPVEINPAFQLGNGYVFLIASCLDRRFPGRFEFINRGVSGNGVRDLQVRWAQDTLAYDPDVISVLVGVNETIRHMRGEPALDATDFQTEYRFLLEQTRRQRPNAAIVVVQPFLLNAGDVTAAWREDLLPRQAIASELAVEFSATFVELQPVFDSACREASAEFWCYDGIHPTHAGFRLLAEAWLSVVAPILGLDLAADYLRLP